MLNISKRKVFAPKHLLIVSKDPKSITHSIKNAGTILVNTPIPFEDYGGAGSNHILPTGKWQNGELDSPNLIVVNLYS